MKTKALLRKARQLQTAETDETLWRLLKTNAYQATLLMQNPPYNIFTITKKSGGQRLIEDPGRELKRIQQQLNGHLQPLYWFNKTGAAYGFMIKPDDAAETRGIVTAARRHMAHPWLLNMDMKDFFHYVKWQPLYERLTEAPFELNHAMARHICHLCTFNGRLPMGAPTSPVLSNIAAVELDAALLNYCKGEGITYTRFADDMSFSSATEIIERHAVQIQQLVQQAGYCINPAKTKWYGPAHEKSITGLTVSPAGVQAPHAFIKETAAEIQHLKNWVLLQARLHPYKELARELVKPLQKIRGALAFIEAVHGPQWEKLLQLERQLDEAVQPPAGYESLHWLEIGYSFF